MEPTRTRTARDLAAAEARSRPSTQFAQQYPTYPEQAQQLRRPPQQAPAPRTPPPDFTDLLRPDQPQPQQQRPRVQQPQAVVHEAAVPAARPAPVRRALGVIAFFLLTAMSLPLHILAVFFIYVQIESPGDVETAVPLLGGLFAAVFIVLAVVGILTQVIGGFPGRWRARVTFSFLSAVIALAVAYAAAMTQF